MNGTCVYLMLCQRFAVVGGKQWHIHTLHTWTYSRRWLSMLAWICTAKKNLKGISSLWQKQVPGSRCLYFSKSSAHTSANTRREATVLQTGQAQSYHTMVPSHSGVISWLRKSLHRYWHVGWRLSNVSFVPQSKTSSIDPSKCSSHSCNTSCGARNPTNCSRYRRVYSECNGLKSLLSWHYVLQMSKAFCVTWW